MLDGLRNIKSRQEQTSQIVGLANARCSDSMTQTDGIVRHILEPRHLKPRQDRPRSQRAQRREITDPLGIGSQCRIGNQPASFEVHHHWPHPLVKRKGPLLAAPTEVCRGWYSEALALTPVLHQQTELVVEVASQVL